MLKNEEPLVFDIKAWAGHATAFKIQNPAYSLSAIQG